MRLSTLARTLRITLFATFSILAAAGVSAQVIVNDPPPFDPGFPDAFAWPSSGPVGTQVKIIGIPSGETVNRIFFNGLAQNSFNRLMDTVWAAVPTGATTGPIVVELSGGMQSAGNFTVTGPSQPPGIASVTPGAGPVGARIRIRGNGLAGTNGVLFGNLPAQFGVSGDTLVTAIVPDGAAGSSRIRVMVDSGIMYQTQAFFPITPAYAQVRAMAPGQVRINDTVTIQGRGFTGAIAVRFNGARAFFQEIVSDSVLRATVPIGSTTGPVSVQGRFNVAFSSSALVVISPAEIRSMFPAGGPVGTIVRLRGRGFTPSTQVNFNGAVATEVYPSGDTLLTVIVPPGAQSGRVSVTDFGVSRPSQGFFVVFPRPFVTIWGANAMSGNVGDVITLSGRGFTGTRYVRWNGFTSIGFSVVSDSVLTVTVPPQATNGPLIVFGPFNQSNPLPFTVTTAARMGVDGDLETASLYPNPASGPFTLRLPGADAAGTYTLTAHSADGRVALYRSLSGVSLVEGVAVDAALPAGLYVLTLSNGETVARMRLQVQK